MHKQRSYRILPGEGRQELREWFKQQGPIVRIQTDDSELIGYLLSREPTQVKIGMAINKPVDPEISEWGWGRQSWVVAAVHVPRIRSMNVMGDR